MVKWIAEIDSTVDWVKIDPNKMDESGKPIITLNENTTPNKRTTFIVFTQEESGIKEYLKLVQIPKEPDVYVFRVTTNDTLTDFVEEDSHSNEVCYNVPYFNLIVNSFKWDGVNPSTKEPVPFKVFYPFYQTYNETYGSYNTTWGYLTNTNGDYSQRLSSETISNNDVEQNKIIYFSSTENNTEVAQTGLTIPDFPPQSHLVLVNSGLTLDIQQETTNEKITISSERFPKPHIHQFGETQIRQYSETLGFYTTTFQLINLRGCSLTFTNPVDYFGGFRNVNTNASDFDKVKSSTSFFDYVTFKPKQNVTYPNYDIDKYWEITFSVSKLFNYDLDNIKIFGYQGTYGVINISFGEIPTDSNFTIVYNAKLKIPAGASPGGRYEPKDILVETRNYFTFVR